MAIKRTPKRIAKEAPKKDVEVFDKVHPCTISLVMNGVEQITHGDSILECIKLLDFSERKVFTGGILNAQKGDKKFKKTLLVRQLKVLSWGKEIPRVVLAKQLELMLS